MKFLPNVFDHIDIVSTYDNNPRMQLIYNGEKVNAYHDDIQIQYGKVAVIKCDMYGASCGNAECKNGIIGFTDHTVKGKTTTQKYNNTTVWRKGHLVMADVTITETSADRVVKETKYCDNPIHSIKHAALVLDHATGKFVLEKH